MKVQPKVIHILANGKKVKSIEGHVVPQDSPAYDIIFRAYTKKDLDQEATETTK